MFWNKKPKVDLLKERVKTMYPSDKLSDNDIDSITSYIRTGNINFVKTLLRQREINPVDFEGVADRLRTEFMSTDEYKKNNSKK